MAGNIRMANPLEGTGLRPVLSLSFILCFLPRSSRNRDGLMCYGVNVPELSAVQSKILEVI
jgi:hypothetical protein